MIFRKGYLIKDHKPLSRGKTKKVLEEVVGRKLTYEEVRLVLTALLKQHKLPFVSGFTVRDYWGEYEICCDNSCPECHKGDRVLNPEILKIVDRLTQ